MYKQILTLLSIVAILSTLSIVYAEEESQPHVSFDVVNGTDAVTHAPFDISEDRSSCRVVADGEFRKAVSCLFVGLAPDGSETVYDTEKLEWTSEIILEQEAKEDYENTIEAQELEEAKKVPHYERIQYLENKNTPTTQDLRELELLKKLGALCRNDTLVSQTYREFEVPTQIYRDHEGNMAQSLYSDQSITTSSLRTNVNIKTLEKAVQECIGQPFTKKSSQYDHIVVDDNSPNHRDIAIGIPVWSQDRANQEANFQRLTVQENPMCTSFNSDVTKRMYGCIIEGERTPYTTKPTPDMTDHGADIFASVAQYKLDGGLEQREKIQEHLREEFYRGQRN